MSPLFYIAFKSTQTLTDLLTASRKRVATSTAIAVCDETGGDPGTGSGGFQKGGGYGGGGKSRSLRTAPLAPSGGTCHGV